MGEDKWEQLLKEVNEREANHYIAETLKAIPLNMNYVGKWHTDGFRTVDGLLVSHDHMWELTTAYKYMCKLSNIESPDGKALTHLGATKLPRCLELGCDWGHCFSVFENYFEEVYGIETLQSAAQSGQHRGYNITWGLMEHTPYQDSFFDVVLSNHVLEHGCDADITIKEIARITKPNGWSVHTLPCTRDDIAEPVSVTHKSVLSYQEWSDKFYQHGFNIETEFFTWNHNQEEFNIIARKTDE